MNARSRVIVALDMPTEAQARAGVEALGNPAQHEKIGLPRLCAACPARAGVEDAGAHGVTSLRDAHWREIGIDAGTDAHDRRLAHLAQAAGPGATFAAACREVGTATSHPHFC